MHKWTRLISVNVFKFDFIYPRCGQLQPVQSFPLRTNHFFPCFRFDLKGVHIGHFRCRSLHQFDAIGGDKYQDKKKKKRMFDMRFSYSPHLILINRLPTAQMWLQSSKNTTHKRSINPKCLWIEVDWDLSVVRHTEAVKSMWKWPKFEWNVMLRKSDDENKDIDIRSWSDVTVWCKSVNTLR